VNQVWAADITYIPMSQGFLYLVAIMDWYSRYALAWTLANIMDVYLCIQALEQGIQVSMDGKGRYPVNILVERLWRSVKYEEVYLKAYQTGTEARNRIDVYLNFYNRERPHQALGYRAPGPAFD
jgi:putative transposase